MEDCHRAALPAGGCEAWRGYCPLHVSLLCSSKAKLKQSIRIPALIIERETAGYSAQAFLMWRVLKRCMDASPEGDGRVSWSPGSVHLKIMCASAKARWPEKCSEDHYSPQSGLRDGHRADKILSIFMPLNQLYPHVLQMQIIWRARRSQSDSADWNNWMQDIQSQVNKHLDTDLALEEER